MEADLDTATAELAGEAMAGGAADLPHLKCVLYCGPSNVSVDVVLGMFQLSTSVYHHDYNTPCTMCLVFAYVSI